MKQWSTSLIDLLLLDFLSWTLYGRFAPRKITLLQRNRISKMISLKNLIRNGSLGAGRKFERLKSLCIRNISFIRNMGGGGIVGTGCQVLTCTVSSRMFLIIGKGFWKLRINQLAFIAYYLIYIIMVIISIKSTFSSELRVYGVLTGLIENL